MNRSVYYIRCIVVHKNIVHAFKIIRPARSHTHTDATHSPKSLGQVSRSHSVGRTGIIHYNMMVLTPVGADLLHNDDDDDETSKALKDSRRTRGTTSRLGATLPRSFQYGCS